MGYRLSTEAPMTCLVCKQNDIVPGTATVTFERGPTTVLIKAVPAMVCANCGEQYVDESTTKHVLELAEPAARSGVELAVLQFAAT
jgi:YgiT-type zinc finger domain-containing protein